MATLSVLTRTACTMSSAYSKLSLLMRSSRMITPTSKLRVMPLSSWRSNSEETSAEVNDKPRCESTTELKPESNKEMNTDAMDDCDQAVYYGLLSTQIRLVKSFSLMTSALGLAAQPVFIWHAKTMENLAVTLGFGFFLSVFTFATPLLVHQLSKKYVTELRYNQLTDTYTAITLSLLLRKRQLQFKVQDVQVPPLVSPFTTFRARDVPLFVDVDSFSDRRHYGKLMGYDKPINLRN